MSTWTFYGHWEEDVIVITDWCEGAIGDDREDDGEYEQGLWAASGEGATFDEAMRATLSEYESDEAVTDSLFMAEI